MKYMGSKRRIAKDILPIILKDRKPGQWYVEPFAGGMNSICEVDGDRIANEYNEYVTAMWDALINKDWSPPNSVTEDQYSDIKKNKGNYPKELVGFCGIALTFGSTWFGTYARNKRGTNFAMEGRSNLMRQVQKLKGVVLYSKSYIDLEIPPKSIIYCDPPYQGTAGYKDKFDHDIFWEWCRIMKKMGHTIFISEYNAPEDFKCVWQDELKSNLRASSMKVTIEKLFTL